MTWTTEELEKVAATDELELATRKADGGLRPPVTIWAVRVGDEIYVRAVNGPTGKWFGHAAQSRSGHVEAGGIKKDVNFVDATDDVKAAVDAAYQSKYNKYGPSIVGSTLTPKAQAATLKLQP